MIVPRGNISAATGVIVPRGNIGAATSNIVPPGGTATPLDLHLDRHGHRLMRKKKAPMPEALSLTSGGLVEYSAMWGNELAIQRRIS